MLLRESDFVSLHARLTEGTKGLLDRQALRLMKESAYLINTARSELVQEGALREALEQRWIAGAALDVFYREPPPPDDWILALDNVTLSPFIITRTAARAFRAPLRRSRPRGAG